MQNRCNSKKIIKYSLLIVVALIFIKSIFINIDVFKANTRSEQIWSIGIYEGDTITELKDMEEVKNPILTAKDVTDISAKFVADPFVIEVESKYYMFFEILDNMSNKGVIGLATSMDLINWDYDKVVLEEEFHLSYPYVFEYENEYYMLPEGGKSGYLSLYKANNFPYEWEQVNTLLRGSYADASIFQHDGKWWILASLKDENGGTHFNNLHLYYSESLFEGWTEHVSSPILTEDAGNSRPAGRVFIENDKIIRFAQNCNNRYGASVSAFEITKLNEIEYEEKLLGEVLTGSGIQGSWNEGGMHQIDVQRNIDGNLIAVVDGDYTNRYNIILENYKRKLEELIGKDD